MSDATTSASRRGTVFLQALPDFGRISETVRSVLADRSDLRVWVPRCGAGAEACSWAALLRAGVPRKLRIFATDTSLRAAIEGTFSDDEVGALGESERRSMVVRAADGWEVAPSLRQHLVCAEHDLGRDPPLGKLDAIGLMSAAASEPSWLDLVPRLADSLRIGGLLYVGDALPDALPVDELRPIGPGLYQRLGRHGTEPIATPDGPAPLPSDSALLACLAPPSLIVDAQGRVRRRIGAVHGYLLAPHVGWPRALADALPPPLVEAAQAAIRAVRGGAQAGREVRDGVQITSRPLPNHMTALIFEPVSEIAALTARNARLAARLAALEARLGAED